MYKVVVKEIGTDKVIRTVLCGISKRRAEKTESGININLDHELYYTEIVEPENDS